MARLVQGATDSSGDNLTEAIRIGLTERNLSVAQLLRYANHPNDPLHERRSNKLLREEEDLHTTRDNLKAQLADNINNPNYFNLQDNSLIEPLLNFGAGDGNEFLFMVSTQIAIVLLTMVINNVVSRIGLIPESD